ERVIDQRRRETRLAADGGERGVLQPALVDRGDGRLDQFVLSESAQPDIHHFSRSEALPCRHTESFLVRLNNPLFALSMHFGHDRRREGEAMMTIKAQAPKPALALSGDWLFPTEIRFGVGRLAELGDACRRLGMMRPLIVTDRGLGATPLPEMVRAAAAAGGIDPQ